MVVVSRFVVVLIGLSLSIFALSAVYLSELSADRLVAHHATSTPAPNQPPTAAFTVAQNNLRIEVDGSTSSDADGLADAYLWEFGDGTTSTRPTADHTYAAAGTYTVTLTVTGDKGATGTKSEIVTVAEEPVVEVLAEDQFERNVINGWGNADVGGPWTTSATRSNFAVATEVGTLRMAAAAGPRAYLNSVSARDVDIEATVSFDKPSSGSGIYTAIIARRASNSDYRTEIRGTTTATEVRLRRTVNGLDSVLGTAVVPGGALPVGQELHARMQVVGDGSTTLRAKVWRAGSPEPEQWTVTSTDGTAQLQVGGAVGVDSYLSGSATNAPIVARFGSFKVIAP